MVKDKLNNNVSIWVWLGTIFGTLLSHAYEIYHEFKYTAFESRTDIFITVISMVISIAFTVAMTYVIAMVIYTLAYRRYVRFISRRDFCLLAMSFTAMARIIVGLIEVFSILEPDIYSVTDGFLSYLVHAIAMMGMFIAINKAYRLNPVERANAFRAWSLWYLVGMLILIALNDGIVLLLSDGSEFSANVIQMMLEMGTVVYISQLAIDMSIASFALFGTLAIATLAMSIVLTKKARSYQDPETRSRHYSKDAAPHADSDEPFTDITGDSSKDKNVFDEFDI